MSFAAPRTPFGDFLLSFALLIGALSRRVDEHRERAEHSRALYDAVMNRLNKLFLRVHFAIQAHEPGRPVRTPSAACHAAAAAARAARAEAAASGASGSFGAADGMAAGVTFTGYMRLPRGFGWLARIIPEAEAHKPHLRDILNDPVLAELIATAPSVRRTLLSLCNMLGLGNFMVQPKQEAALGRYNSRQGWRAPKEPAREESAAPDGRDAPDAPDTARPASPPGRRQDE